MKNIILASTSPRRKEILSKTGLKFKTVASRYKEEMDLGLEPEQLAKHLSKKKAEDVAKRYPDSIIIGADTFVVLGDKLLGKPASTIEAKKMLRQISGKRIQAITGFTIIDTGSGKILSKSVKTEVYIKKLTEKEITNYVKSGEPMNKAGAFAVQLLGAVLIRKIEGDFYNVMGLPLFELARCLEKFGIKII